ncbi:MAG: hypothetical protein R2845_01915 [Thermomicrobiales bacterium]
MPFDAEYGPEGASAVTGQTVVDIDVDEALSAALIVYIGLSSFWPSCS